VSTGERCHRFELEGALQVVRRDPLDEHAERCPDCASRYGELVRVIEAIAKLPEPPALQPNWEERWIERLNDELSRTGGDLSLTAEDAQRRADALSDGSQLIEVAEPPRSSSPAHPRSQTRARSRVAPGDILAEKYKLVARINCGSTASVWEAVNEVTGRRVVIKMPLSSSEQSSRMLLREARAHGRVSHVNIVDILDVCESEAREPLLVMPLLRGETMRRSLRRPRCMEPLTAAQVGQCVARALNAAHAVGIVHGGLRLEKVFLHEQADAEDIVKVLGFRAQDGHDREAAPRGAGAIGGDCAYTEGERVDTRSDVLAFGVLMSELFTGAALQPGASQAEVEDTIRARHSGVSAELDLIIEEIARLISCCLRREIEARPTSLVGVELMLGHYVRLWRGGTAAERPAPTRSDARPSIREVRPHLAEAIELPLWASVSTDKLGTPTGDWSSLLRCG
jgi:hypothetical protein